MDDRSHSVFRENSGWLHNDKLTHYKIADGAAHQLAKLILTEFGEVSPTEAIDIWRRMSADPADLDIFALLCRYIAKVPPHEDNAPTHKSAVYFRNSVADRAYDGFSRIYKNLGAVYAADFKSVCEDVYYDRADACILPLESSEDGLLMSFRHMLTKYELSIISAIKIPTGEDSYQVMALLTNGSTDPMGDVCEFYLPALPTLDFIAVCKSIEILSAEVLRVTSVPSKNGETYDHHICLTASPDNICRIRFFLDAVDPANILLGQYKNYNTERNIP